MAFDLGRVQKDIRKLRRFLKHAPKHTMPKKVHSLRTAIRRFEAAMQALALDSNANERRLLRKLAKLRKRAGKVRDLDVLTGYVADLNMSGEEECLVQLLEYLGSEHARRNQQLHSSAVRHGESLRRRLKRTARHLKTSPENVTAYQTAPGYTMLTELRLQRELTEPIRLTRNNLHPYRLQVKELRYMLQMEKDPADLELIETLGQVKDAIGEWHDWEELLTIARDHLAHGSKCKLIPLIQTTTQQKLKHALAVTNAGRRQMQRSPAESKREA
ncbi:MAG TPA: CHAD domain-containing protein [Acidobacteriaceae bacterium]|nr:CHAD domain-containing protein [Acidobacteriaceae bacterium]